MSDVLEFDTYFSELKWKLSKIAGFWNLEDYKDFIRLYSSSISNVMEVERCTFFILEL